MTPGFHLRSLHLKNTLRFKDVSFEVTPGITAVYGLNRTNARTSGNGNGAGKSFVFSQIGEIAYESPIVGERQDGIKVGNRVIKTYIKGKKVDIKRMGSKLEIVVEGKPKKFRTKPLAKQWLADHLPLNQEEFNAYAYMDARIPHPLVMGSSTERKKFFTSFFGLDKLDMERKLFTAELAKLGKIKAAYSEVMSEYRTAKEQLMDDDRLESKTARVEELQEELTDLNAKNIRLQTYAQLLNFEASAKLQLKVLRELCPDGITSEEFTNLVESNKWNLKTNKADLEEAQAWEQYQRDCRHYDKAVAKLSADATKLVAKFGLKDARTKCKDSADQVAKVRSRLSKARSEVKTLEAQLSEPLPKKVKTPEGDKKEIRARLDSLEHQYAHGRKFKSGSCETCGQAVKIKDPAELKARIEALEETLEAFDDANIYKQAVEKQASMQAELAEAQAIVDTETPKIESLGRYAVLVDELVDVPRRPAKFEGKKLEVCVKQRMLEEDRERKQLLEFLQPNLATILALQALTDKQRQSGSMAVRLQARLNAIHEKLSKLRASLEVNALVMTNVKRLRTKLKSMKAELVNEEALRLLVESYSDKAMKRMAVQAISSRLMTEVNKYARYVFAEDFSFEFKWDSSQLQILVHRRYGKKTDTSDVRKLSGAESKLFTWVLVLALLTFVPARKRCNFMIMDEPAANLSLESLEKFKALLPILNKVIPSIIILTPRTDERYVGAREITVLKEKGGATLVEGHPSTIKKGN